MSSYNHVALPSDKIFCLIDCNNFFVSCERVFKPELRDVPVAVLSNNDACVIARSQEVKAMGIKMGEPVFKHKKLLQSRGVRMFSANFSLYGDMSSRVVELLKEYSTELEVYSIDECFVDITKLAIRDYDEWARRVRAEILRSIGLPVSVGIGRTKTLAKLACERVKKDEELRPFGGYSLVMNDKQEEARRWKDSLMNTPVEDVWGFGRQYSKKLRGYGATSALAATEFSNKWIRQNFAVTGLRTIEELKGMACLGLDDSDFDGGQKMVSTTRSFGTPIRQQYLLENALATFAARVAEKLRRKDQVAARVTVFANNGWHAKKRYSRALTFNLDYPTADTGQLVEACLSKANSLYSTGIGLKKAGVIMHSLAPGEEQQLPLLNCPTSDQLMTLEKVNTAVDSINKRYGKYAIGRMAETDGKSKWHSKSDSVTPAYTSRWDQIPKVKLTTL